MRRACNHLYANSRYIGNARVQRYGLSIATEPAGNKNALFSAKQILSSTKGRAGAFAFITVPSLIIASNMNSYSKMEAAAEGVVLLQDLKNVKDAEEKKKSNKKEVSSAMLLIQSMKPEWWLYLIAGLSSTLLSLLGSFQAKAFGALLGALRDGNTSIFNPVKNIVIIFLGQAGLGFISSYSLAIAVTNLGTRLRQNLFDSILSQDIELFDRKSSGELSNMLGNDIASMQTSIRTSFTSGIEGVASLISGGIHLFATSPTLAGVMLTLLPLGTLSANLLGFILSSLSEKTRKANAQASGIASECISSIRTVRAFNSEEHESKRYEDSLEEVASLKVKMAALTGAFFASIRLGINLSSVLVCAIGKILMDRGDLQFSDIAALLAQVQLIERALAQLSVVSAQVSKSLTSSEHIFKLIQQRPTVNVSRSIYQEKLDVSKIQGRVEFNNISFVYPTRPDAMVIEGLSLVIEPGQYVSIVGGSGSGKTTTVSLLERFYDISKGQILIDGIDIRDMRPQDLHSIIAIVSQQPDLFSCSIADNIRYGKPNATMEEVREAARKANALEFIESFPKGFDTMCGERGVSLSGGQRQRIAIARAILRQPKILILDECTSALDSESEHSIQVALRELMQGRTTIAISHRLATVVNSDSIVVLEEGKIVEKGKHADLMKNDAGSYKNLFKRQNTRSLPRKE